MVVAFRPSVVPFEKAGTGPSLQGIQNVWKLLLIVGLIAILISWTRESKSNVPDLRSPKGSP
jgi:hypothetical protein